ncbi:MAG: TIGR03663 family protein [Anaerolineae bacterium]|nr:MAG: TIGR03663 family protein [Anaerolineae bacterium]
MEEKRPWLERPVHPAWPALTYEVLLFGIILVATVVTRFYDLGARVMSHDESLHTYFSWLLARGQGYQHSPMMHGPLQFHLLALTYFLFGASDFTARIPAALFSIATVWMVWYWRRYLGRIGALIAAALMVISPYMLYYGRYVRNEAYAGLAGLLMLYAMLRHLETGHKRYLYLLSLALVIHFTAKETAFIYAAQALLFLAVYFIVQVTRIPWEDKALYQGFLIALAVGVLLLGAVVGVGLYTRHGETVSGAETVAPANPSAPPSPLEENPPTSRPSATTALLVMALLALGEAGYLLVRGYGWERLRAERSFGQLIVIGTLVLPMLTPFPLNWLKWTIPTSNADLATLTTSELLRLGVFIIPAFALSAVVGLLWDRDWWKIATVFYGIFTLLYTTFFTNGGGFFTGLIGSLGYWLVQQGVERGSQPWYYYLLIQIPVYEFLPALGSILALYLGFRRKLPASTEGDEATPEETNFPRTFSLLAWWTVSSVLAYTYAGEKMPWLTYHIAWPMILMTGWGLGYLIQRTDWDLVKRKRPALTVVTMVIFIVSLTTGLSAAFGPNPPFQGKTLEQLQATADFLLPALVTVLSGIALAYLLREWTTRQVLDTLVLCFFGFLAVLTARAAFRAAYINYDYPTEYLVYAHGARGVKEVMAQVEELSRRTTGGLEIALAYDASAPDTGVSWPFVWYLRDYTNQRAFDAPTNSLRESLVIIVDQKNFTKIEPVVGDAYYRFDYIRMWWPNQDYFNLFGKRDPAQPFDETYPCRGVLGFLRLWKSRDFSRLCNAILDPRIRAGIYNIWLNRDYRLYAQATGNQHMTLTTWEPSDRMRLYIRKDVAAKIWEYGTLPSGETLAQQPYPYEDVTVRLAADLIVGAPGQGEGQFNAPRGIAFAPDGSFYVADSRNHRIQHFSAEGEFLGAWGAFADSNVAPAPPGTFNEPWGVAVGPDGSVYVADTWNHRIQKFTANGEFLATWGHYGLAEDPEAFWGPRGIAVDKEGRVYVSDTGNKRIVIFDADGNYITEFGSAGLDPGQFDEPVGIAIGPDGTLYVADTWNQRIQSFTLAEDGRTYIPHAQWPVDAWYGQSLDNKPFIAVNEQGHVFITDPEGYRVIEFDPSGEAVRVWGEYGIEDYAFGLAAGIAVDPEGHIWVTDAENQRVMRFTLP